MKPLPIILAITCAFCIVPSSGKAQTPQKIERQVAVTIDDLPAGMADRLPAADITTLTAKLLGTLRDQKIPVVFNSVTDPYAAKAANSPTDKPANLTGVQAMPPVEAGMRVMLEVVPNAKRIGIVWNPAEANSTARGNPTYPSPSTPTRAFLF